MDAYDELVAMMQTLFHRTIIVEGKKDRSALIALGIEKEDILLLKGPLFAVAEVAAAIGKPVAILTDFDKEGKALYRTLRTTLERQGATVDDRFRNFLSSKTTLSHVEGISTYAAMLRDR